jgi:PLP dependent protein
MGSIADNLQAVIGRIARAAVSSGRSPGELRLLAVSKTWPASAVIEAVAAGQADFGENYVQEGVEKILALRALGLGQLRWHFIGPLQGNKTRWVAEYFDWVHSVDNLRHAERLSAQRPADLPALNVCVQVNISREASKSGCAPDEAAALGQRIAALPGLRWRGLMAIPEPATDFAAQRAPLAEMKSLFDRLRVENPELDTLSMGMSHDLEAAVSAGASMVRVGTAIFGQRESA